MAVEFLGTVDKVPERSKNGDWGRRFENDFKPNQGTTYRFKGASSSTASNLRRDHGLDAFTQTEEVKGEDGKVTKEVFMYVTWLGDEKAKEIQADFASASAKRKNGAKGKGNGAATATAAKAGASK
jgi:hypothetical protein